MGSITPAAPEADLDILIIGGGMSGCYALYSFRKLTPTPKIKVLEAGSSFGGVWYHNRYPGARVDTEWPMYQLSIPEVYKDWSFEQRFPDHKALRAYFKHMDQVLDLNRDTFFNTVVDRIDWDDQRRRWTTKTQNGKTFTSRYLVVCSGSSYKRHVPDLPGLDTFRGTIVHSAAYPDEGVDTSGKRVGLLGAGATAVQIVQELAPTDCQFINFIRTHAIAFPLVQSKIDPNDEKNRKPEYDALFKRLRKSRAGFTYESPAKAFKDASDEEKWELFWKLWNTGGFAFGQSNYREYLSDEEVNKYFYKFWAERVRERVTDPEKQQILAPIPQTQWFGTKRPPLENGYYEALDRPNVKIVDLKKSGIREIVEKGVVTEDGTLYELDILICATGFDAMNGSQVALGISDKHGVSLREKWSRGTDTYLGICIPGMPNLFMSYGPGGPTALGNGPPIIETAVDWISEAIQKMETDGIETVEPRLDVAKKWRQDIQDVNGLLLLDRADSWWMGANIPGKFREQLNYVKGLDAYKVEIDDALDGWKGFDVVKKNGERQSC